MEYSPAIQTSRPGFARSYVTQYISLMILILTFTVGAFTRHKLGGVRPVEVQRAPAAADKQLQTSWLNSGIVYADLFSSPDSALDHDKALALAAVLRNHDIDAEIQISGEGDLGVAVGRTIKLYRFLLETGVPAAAARIYGVKNLSPLPGEAGPAIQARVRWFRPNAPEQESAISEMKIKNGNN